MLFLTTQPDSNYYIWQLQVQINNFKKFGCEDKCVILFGYNPIIGINENALKFQQKTSAKVIFYPDTRDLSTRLYLPSIRPHLIKQLYEKNPEIISNKNYLYLDCDIIIANYPDFSKINDEKYVHLTDTDPLFSFNEIKSTKHLFERMCYQVGITPHIVKKNKNHAGGIIYAFKYFHYFNYDFWDKVEKDSTNLYKMMLVTNSKDTFEQVMTANKLALLWNLWLIGYDTKISKELSVSWATNPIEDWETHNFYNNAGVSEMDRDYMFYKGDYSEKKPFNDDFSYVSDLYCSIKYVNEILATKLALKSEK